MDFCFDPNAEKGTEKQELKAMLNKEITITRLAQVRDIFCFCCLTGLAFTDVRQLKPEHLVADIHGKIRIRKARQKTKNLYVSGLYFFANIPVIFYCFSLVSHLYLTTNKMGLSNEF